MDSPKDRVELSKSSNDAIETQRSSENDPSANHGLFKRRANERH
jgi:hypothetical protein